MPIEKGPQRRIVTMDIETVSLDPSDPKGALDAMYGRIACIGLLFEDGREARPAMIADADERKILERFWTSIRDTDLLVGHNILEFDLMFIRQRSWILGVKPPIALNLKKYYTDQVVDLMALWTNWSSRFKGASLDNIAQALGLGEKTAHGSDVAEMWANGEYTRLMDYCMHDVRLAYGIYCRLLFREPVGASTCAQVAASNGFDAPHAHPQHIDNTLFNKPIQMPAPSREPVPVPARRAVAAEAGPSRVEGFAGGANVGASTAWHVTPGRPLPEPVKTAPTYSKYSRQASAAPPRRAQKSRSKQVEWRQEGGALILTGATFMIRGALKSDFGARGSKNGETFEWRLATEQFQGLADLCAEAGLRLVPAETRAA